MLYRGSIAALFGCHRMSSIGARINCVVFFDYLVTYLVFMVYERLEMAKQYSEIVSNMIFG